MLYVIQYNGGGGGGVLPCLGRIGRRWGGGVSVIIMLNEWQYKRGLFRVLFCFIPWQGSIRDITMSMPAREPTCCLTVRKDTSTYMMPPTARLTLGCALIARRRLRRSSIRSRRIKSKRETWLTLFPKIALFSMCVIHNNGYNLTSKYKYWQIYTMTITMHSRIWTSIGVPPPPRLVRIIMRGQCPLDSTPPVKG